MLRTSAKLPLTRKNGFQWPWHIYQVCSWLLYIVIVVFGIVLFGQLFPWPYNIIFYVVSSIGEIAVGILAIVTTWIDPADPMKETNVGESIGSEQ